MRFLILLALVSGAAAQPSAKTHPNNIQSIVDRIAVAPPELGADILLRLIESNAINDRAWKIELLDEAFQLSARAKYPLPITPAVERASNADSDIGNIWTALDQRLSGLALQCRSVHAMLTTDKKRAVELFLDMPLPQAAPLSCKDPNGYDPTEYYVTLKEVTERGFDGRERREGKPFAVLERAIRNMNSPFQVYPVLELILDLRTLPRDQFAALVVAYSSGLKQLYTEDRAFSSSTGYALFQRLLRLAQICRERDISPHALIDAFRTYFVRHMSGPRCPESVDPEGAGIFLTQIGQMFNSYLRPIADDVPEIKKDELKPASIGEAASVIQYVQTPQAKSLSKHVAELLYGTEQERAIYKKEHPPDEIHGPDLLPIEVRREPEWEARAVAFLDELENWKKDQDVTGASYFYQVCMLYTQFIRAIPPGPMYDRVLHSHVLFLRGALIQKDSPPEWFLEFNRMIHLYGASPAELARIGDEIKKSGDDLMALYVDLRRFEKTRAP
jgi:hypothetical protein